MSLSLRDQALVWHPFTQAQTADLPLAMVRGEGAYLYDEEGHAYLDLISSWWVNLHGHGHPKIAKAIYEQALKLEHIIFAGFTHMPAVALCEALRLHLPASLTRFFFSDNGSTAVEIALKMAYQFWRNKGQEQRYRFLSFEGAYHGDTFGAMAVGKGSGFHDHFQKLFFEVDTIPYPSTWIEDEEVETKEAAALQHLKNLLLTYADSTVALIIEPLIQGSSGMRLCRPQFLRDVIDLVRDHNILIIFDEVMTGFGRTGTLLAAEQVARNPDIICLSKGLTGGFLPLSLTVTQDHIYEAFLGATFDKAFSHGHSYTANPLGCAAALASLEILVSPSTQNQICQIGKIHAERLALLSQSLPNTTSYRQLGTIAAFEVTNATAQYGHISGQLLRQYFMEKGLLLRPLGNVVYLLPPYCISSQDLHRAYDGIEHILGK
jgi:adenosylmethionine---8-amino-7-oxononanoate aminotransferase